MKRYLVVKHIYIYPRTENTDLLSRKELCFAIGRLYEFSDSLENMGRLSSVEIGLVYIYTQERAITSRNNYRLARPRGPSSRLFLRLGIPTTKNMLAGKAVFAVRDSESKRQRGKGENKEREIEARTVFRIKSGTLQNRRGN